MKKYWIVIFAACLLVTGCNEKKPQEQVSVVHLDPGKATASVTPSVEATQTPVPTNTPSPTPEPTRWQERRIIQLTILFSISTADVSERLELRKLPKLRRFSMLNLTESSVQGTG